MCFGFQRFPHLTHFMLKKFVVFEKQAYLIYHSLTNVDQAE